MPRVTLRLRNIRPVSGHRASDKWVLIESPMFEQKGGGNLEIIKVARGDQAKSSRGSTGEQ